MNSNILDVSAILLVAAAVATSGCSGAQSGSPKILDERQADIGETSMTLREDSGKCLLDTNANSFRLDIPWPCDFHRGPDDAVRTMTFDDTLIFLLENSKAHPDLPDDCVTQVQAVKAIDGGWQASEYTDKVAACPPFQWDEMMFTGLFSD